MQVLFKKWTMDSVLCFWKASKKEPGGVRTTIEPSVTRQKIVKMSCDEEENLLESKDDFNVKSFIVAIFF